ncbi:MAG TPA: glycosyltransferase family 9 protein [Ignavibacteria bacterium]|nr:glycosyltransferase family 9 protein [Ignavibacteria bacterium]
MELLKLFLKAKPLNSSELPDVKNILIVRQHNQLGDMLCSVPLFEAIRIKYPGARITLVASPINYEILFSDINPFIDDVLVYDKSSVKKILSFIKKLRSRHFDLGFVPSTVSLSRTSHLINYFSGAKVKIGVKSIDGKPNGSEFLLNIKSDFEWDKKQFHQIERNLDIGRQIGCDLPPQERKIKIILHKNENEFAEEFISKNFPDKSKLLIAFHPGAGKIANRWSVENFSELISKLYEKYGNYILITSGFIDKDVTRNLSDLLNEKNIPHTILENTPIRKVGAVLSKTDLFITNDTGVMHVAGGVNANVLSLFGPTNGFEWAPYGENNIYIKSKTVNINDISLSEVFDTAVSMINMIKNKTNE